MTITGLELRRATWEAIGKAAGWALSTVCTSDDIPPIESNNGIALDELVKFCDEREWYWELRVCRPNQVCCILGEDDEGDGMTDICEYGETPAEAICRALIQAASVKA